jgi:hypothetical protein
MASQGGRRNGIKDAQVPDGGQSGSWVDPPANFRVARNPSTIDGGWPAGKTLNLFLDVAKCHRCKKNQFPHVVPLALFSCVELD